MNYFLDYCLRIMFGFFINLVNQAGMPLFLYLLNRILPEQIARLSILNIFMLYFFRNNGFIRCQSSFL